MRTDTGKFDDFDIGDGMNDCRNAEDFDVEKFRCVEKCFDGGMDEKNTDVFGRMVNDVDDVASEMNVDLEDGNLYELSSGMFNGGMGEYCVVISGGRMVKVVDEFGIAMKVELQGDNIDKFSAGKKALLFLVVNW